LSGSSETAGTYPRVTVVGAGVVGLCVAWHLARRGARVTVLDREGPGLGCSYGNSASLSPGSVAPLAMPGVIRNASRMLLDKSGPLHIPLRYWLTAAPWLLRFVAASRSTEVERIAQALSALLHPSVDRHREMLRAIGVENLIRSDGQLFVYRDAQQLEKDRTVWDLRRRHGVQFEVFDREGIRDLEASIGPAYTIGVFLADGAMIANPYRHCQVIAKALVDAGVTIVRDRVVSIEMKDGRADGVRGEGGRYYADAVVVCAGAWSAELLRPLGYRVPLESQRGYHLTFGDSGIEIRRPVIPADRKVFITPQETGLRVGGTVEIGGLAAPPNRAREELLVNDLRAVFPQARVDGPRTNWMGHRPCLPDSMPVLGESERHPGLWFAFGHGHLGLTGSAITGDILARGIFRVPLELDLRPFSIERFA
jgi:glycine/D-amino acid oxidase-like deaminating enzyme